MTSRRRIAWTALLLLAPIGAASSAGTPPEGFVETELVPRGGTSGVQSPTAIAYEPGAGHLWIVEKSGEIRRRDAGSGAVTTALTLDCVDQAGERGGLGIAFAPDYLDGPSSRQVYLYSTRTIDESGACSIPGEPAGVRNQVTRFLELDGSLSDEELILAGPLLWFATNHNGGTLRFAADGTLFIAMGDNDTDALPLPASRDLLDLRGALLRINSDGSIPADNPFVDQPGIRPEIWAWGLRNPFRFSIDEATDTPIVADVGEATWEAAYIGVAGADYGYPCTEGQAPFRSCDPAPPAGSVTDPVLVYGHGSETLPVSGNSITGGPVYRATAFPAEYRGNYFFGDFVDGWIRRATLTAERQLVDIRMFMPDATRVVDMVVSPSGCLTWVSYVGGVNDVCFASGGQDLDGDGVTPDDGDCDDDAATVFPAAPEICDGLDNDCNGAADDGLCTDFDVDGDLQVEGTELVWLGRAFSDCSPDPGAEWWSSVDYTRDGCVDGDDLSILSATFGCAGATPICE